MPCGKAKTIDCFAPMGDFPFIWAGMAAWSLRLMVSLFALALLVTSARADLNPEKLCDKFAAHPNDSDKPADVQGTPNRERLEKENVAAAIMACEKAAASPGAHRRFNYQLARALMSQTFPTNKKAADKIRTRAFLLLHKAADAGSSIAMLQLAWDAIIGGMDPKRSKSKNRQEIKEALYWIEKAATAGNVGGMEAFAKFYESGDVDGTRNIAMAKYWMEKAAVKNVTVMVKLADKLAAGEWGPKDYPSARTWYEKAAAADHNPGSEVERAAMFSSIQAMMIAALWAEEGRGGLKDLSHAKRWYEKATAYCNKEAALKLGAYAETGAVEAIDLSAAIAYYKLAIDLGRHKEKVEENLNLPSAITPRQPMAPNVQAVIADCQKKLLDRDRYFGDQYGD